MLLTSANFGEASSRLNGSAPQDVVERLLRELAKAAMAQPGMCYMTDEEANGSSPTA